jgi:hypothetical protein
MPSSLPGQGGRALSDYVDACVLEGHTGTSLTVGHEAGTRLREAVSAAAERVLAGRHAGPLIQLLPVGGLMIWIRPRSRHVRQYLFEGGTVLAANVGPGPRLVVLPWADLAKVTTSFDDDDLLSRCELRVHSGTKLLLGRGNHDGYVARLAIMRAAQQVLAGQSPGT